MHLIGFWITVAVVGRQSDISPDLASKHPLVGFRHSLLIGVDILFDIKVWQENSFNSLKTFLISD